jgi:hypothetical protein
MVARAEAAYRGAFTFNHPGASTMFKKTASTLFVTAASAFCFAALAADPASDATLTKSEAKDLKTQSEAQYKARKNVAEANQDLNKGDCKTALEGSAKRACLKSAKASAKSDKADAKTLHEVEEQKIKAVTK